MSPYEHAANGASTLEATPRLRAAGAGNATSAKHALSSPSYGKVPDSSKANRREGHLASVQMKLVIFTLFFCSSAECSSLAATASRRRRQRPGHRHGHHDQVRATQSERRRGKRSRLHDQVLATHSEQHRGQRPRHHNHVPTTNNCRGQPHSHHDQIPAWYRGHWPGYQD